MIKLTDSDKKMINEVKEITMERYNEVMVNDEWYIEEDNLIYALEDLLCEYGKIKEDLDNEQEEELFDKEAYYNEKYGE